MFAADDIHLATGLAPAADLYNGNPATDVVSLANYDRALFVLQQKTAGTNTGTATITMEECSTAAGASNVAIAFRYRKKTTGASDTWGAWIAATTSGFVTTANEDTMYEVEVKADQLSESKPFLRMQLTETVNDPVTGAVLIALYPARYNQDQKPTALA